MAQRRKNKRKYIYWLVVLTLFVAAGVVVFLVWNNYFRDKGENKQENESAEVVNDEDDANAKKDVESKDSVNDEAKKAEEEKKVVP